MQFIIRTKDLIIIIKNEMEEYTSSEINLYRYGQPSVNMALGRFELTIVRTVSAIESILSTGY